MLFLMSWALFSHAQQLVINEFQSSNFSTMSDEDGEYVDWIELYNNSETALIVEGYYLSDDAANLTKWSFPSLHLSPHQFLIVFASGKDRKEEEFALHTNFKIKSKGEVVYLTNPSGILIDSLPSIALSGDEPCGRLPDGSENWGNLTGSTPGYSNNEQSFLKTISFSKPAGFHADYLNLEMTCEDSIFYTVDGTIPTESSVLYEAPIFISADYPNRLSLIPTSPLPTDSEFSFNPPSEQLKKGITVNAIAFKNGSPSSRLYTKTYFTDNSGYTFPVISLTTDSLNLFGEENGIYVPGASFNPDDIFHSGNYNKRGVDWERVGNMEYFNEDGELEFSEQIGFRIAGNRSRLAPQKSLRIYFRNAYGNSKITYPFFPGRAHKTYKRLVVRSTFSYWWKRNTMFQDDIIHTIIDRSSSNMDVQMSTPVVMYINGEYWGVHNLRERQDKYYIEANHGIHQDSVNIIGGNMVAEEGSAESFENLLEFVIGNDMSNTENYISVSHQLDINNFIDYVVFETYFGNNDWPKNNVRLWSAKGEEAKWRCLFYDLDGAIGDPLANPFDLNEEAGNIGILFQHLCENQDFQTQFIDRYVYLLKTTFNPANIKPILDEFMTIYGKEIPEHTDRWGSPYHYQSWENSCNYFRDFIENRPCAIKEHLMSQFDLQHLNAFDCSYLQDEDFIRIFPNPGVGLFQVVFEYTDEVQGTLTIYNAMGQNVYHQNLQNLNQQAVDVSFLENGVYLFRFNNKGRISTRKVIIQK